MYADSESASQLDIRELQASPFDTGFLCPDCSFAQCWENYALLPRNIVYDLRFGIFIIFEKFHMKANCGVIPVTTSKLERLATKIIVRVQEFVERAEEPGVCAFRLIPGQVFDSI